MANDPFLSDPSRKRKRLGNRTTSTTKRKQGKHLDAPRVADKHDEEISSDSDDEDQNDSGVSDARDDEDLSSDEEFAGENAADKRRRLAKQYLDNLKNNELTEDFDAQDLDDDIVARRLQVDVAENKGFVYKFIGDVLLSQKDDLRMTTTRIGSKNATSLSIRYPYMYTVSKDMELIKWNISVDKNKPQRIKHVKGGPKFFTVNTANPGANHHFDQINCVATSPDGKYVVTGGNDSRLIIWSAENLSCLKVLPTRSAVNAISFRRGTDQLYAACADLRIRTFSINQFAQLEILYGHQDNITDISALSRETCVSVGSRDKTAMFWKISEESRLTFRGGDSVEKKRKKRDADEDDKPFHSEGSIEVVSMVDESHFVTGSDNGNIALWSLAKKKPLFTERLGHGLEPLRTPAQASAETEESKAALQIPQRQPYWITAIHALPFSDIFVSGSYNGSLKVWKIGQDGLRSFSLLHEVENVNGVVVKIDSVEVKDLKKMVVHALVSKEHKFGRWLGKVGGRNALVSFAFDI